MGCFLLAVGGLAVVVGGIWILILAFQESIGWGIAVLLFTPATIAFIFIHWDKSKKPAVIYLLGVFLMVGGAFSGAGVNSFVDSDYADADYGDSGDDEYADYDDYSDDSGGKPVRSGGSGKPIESANRSSLDTELDLELEGVADSSLPEQRVDRSTRRRPPSKQDDRPPLTLETASSYVGVYVVVTKRSGQRVRGYLLDVTDDQITLESLMGGGKMTFPISKSDVRKIEEP